MPIGAGNERDIIPAPRTRRPADSARLASLHAPRSPAMSIREVLRAHGAWAVLLAALVLPPYAHLLAGDEAALGRDYGKLFADVIEQQRRAWSDGELLLWDPSQLGGTTAWGLPNEASFYPPLVALVMLRGTVAGLNTCIVLHVLWGARGLGQGRGALAR